MEAYRFYTPRMQGRQMTCEVWDEGDSACQLCSRSSCWQERNLVKDGIVSVNYACARCDRGVCQSLNEAVPSQTWIGAPW